MNDRIENPNATSIVRQRQAPLIEQYREDPRAALIPKQARTVTERDAGPFHVSVSVDGPYPRTAWELGIDDKIGGDNDLPNAAEMMLAALAGCYESTLRMVADRLAVSIVSLEVIARGDVDARGCLAMDPAVRVGFPSIEMSVHLEVEEGTDPRRVEMLYAAADRLCVTKDTLENGVPITIARDP
ncbi:MAG: OsmC family protein [Trueperaceae bacterium]|nr:OsmC family protein [Trueperaceae bacterium]